MMKIIVWNEKIRRSQDVVRAVIDQINKDTYTVDGVAETFNNGKQQGCVLKLFDKYNPDVDMCIWVYLPAKRKVNNHIEIIIGKHIDCNKLNMWDESSDLKKISIEDRVALKMHGKTRDTILDIIRKKLERVYDIPSL